MPKKQPPTDTQPDCDWRDAAVLIVAHGAGSEPRARADTEAHAARLRGLGWFAEVETAFFADGTRPGEVIAGLSAEKVYVVPHFMGAGYFVRDRLPAEIGPAAKTQRVVLCAPPSMHPEFPALVADIVAETSAAAGIAKGSCRIVLVAHGSDRYAASADHAGWVRDHLVGAGAVECGFLEQHPRLDIVLENSREHTIVAGLFAAHGRHATKDVISAIQSVSSTGNRQSIIYTGPVGASERMTPLFTAQIRALDAAGGRVAGAL